MSRRLDIGVVSYGRSDSLRRTLCSIRDTATTDYRVLCIDNPGPDPQNRPLIEHFAAEDSRFVPVFLAENMGYAGGVNELMRRSESEYTAYCDHDVMLRTRGWDEQMARLLDIHHEVGMVFPNGGAYMIDRGDYQEIMWAPGFCWMLSRLCMVDTGQFDTSLGHQEEADYCLRVRMAGYKCAAIPSIFVAHEAAATNDPASIERINRGVVRWVDRWNRYFNGKNFNYHSPNVTRWHDWSPNALYLEEYFKLNGLASLNTAPETVTINGEKFDLIKVPRLSGFYTGRII